MSAFPRDLLETLPVSLVRFPSSPHSIVKYFYAPVTLGFRVFDKRVRDVRAK